MLRLSLAFTALALVGCTARLDGANDPAAWAIGEGLPNEPNEPNEPQSGTAEPPPPPRWEGLPSIVEIETIAADVDDRIARGELESAEPLCASAYVREKFSETAGRIRKLVVGSKSQSGYDRIAYSYDDEGKLRLAVREIGATKESTPTRIEVRAYFAAGGQKIFEIAKDGGGSPKARTARPSEKIAPPADAYADPSKVYDATAHCARLR